MSIEKMKKILELNGSDLANQYLELGWTMIGVFQYQNDNIAHPVFVVGWEQSNEPVMLTSGWKEL